MRHRPLPVAARPRFTPASRAARALCSLKQAAGHILPAVAASSSITSIGSPPSCPASPERSAAYIIVVAGCRKTDRSPLCSRTTRKRGKGFSTVPDKEQIASRPAAHFWAAPSHAEPREPLSLGLQRDGGAKLRRDCPSMNLSIEAPHRECLSRKTPKATRIL